MTLKGVLKLVSQPNRFLKDYAKKNYTKEQLKSYGKKALLLEVPSHLYYYNLFKTLKENNHTLHAEIAIKKAISKKKKPLYYHELALILRKRNQWWQVLDAYEKAFELSSNSPKDWVYKYAEALDKMRRYEKAIEVLNVYYEENKLDVNRLFFYANLLEKNSKKNKVKQVFQKIIKIDTKNNSKQIGIGIFYEKKENYLLSYKYYNESIDLKPIQANLYYKKSFSLDKLYRWKEAESGYLKAIGLSLDTIDWYYRLGYVRERQKKYSEAAEAYSYAVSNRPKHTPYWYYRLGYVLYKDGQYEASTKAFLMMKNIVLDEIEENPNFHYKNFREKLKKESISLAIQILENSLSTSSIDFSTWLRLAKTYESLEDYSSAIENYNNALDRKEDFDANIYFDLGYCLTKDFQYKKASEAFISQRILQDAHGIVENNYVKNKRLHNLVNYTEYYEHLTIENKTILYESYHGASISCNPYALFKTLILDQRFEGFKHIWVINDKSKIPNSLTSNKNVIFIRRDTDKYMRYLASAKYLINNTSFPVYYIRKEEQIYLNTWHGTPIKTLGKDVKADFMAHKNQTRNFLQASHLISPNEYTSEILLNSYDIKDTFSGVFATVGYPRQDLMLNISKNDKEVIQKDLNIDINKKTVLYAPTWRGTVANAVFDVDKLVSDIVKMKEIDDIQILFRGHYMVEEKLANLQIDITVVPASIDSNSLLSIVDVLVTDYSSICFDFMALAKPIVYYVYDREKYEEERGLYFDLEELGGEICYTSDELKKSLNILMEKEDISETQKKAQKKFSFYDDGMATKRVVDLIFFDKKEDINIYKKVEKESILLYGGPLMANGITTSFINLANHINKDKYSVTLIIDPLSIVSDDLRMEQFNKFNSDIKILPRVGQLLRTLEEAWVLKQFNNNMNLHSEEQWNLYESLHKRELKRVIGYGTYNHIINFEGYTVFWSSLMGMKLNKSQTNAIYQHNDLFGEWNMKHYYLEQTFNLYRFYDKFVSVSKATKDYNRVNLSKIFSLEEDKFVYCDNLQNPETILAKSKDELEVLKDNKIFEKGKVFINIGRLSPEKGHKKLIYAFQKVLKKYPDARLINLGDGVLKDEINTLIDELTLTNKIFFLGQRSNPYAYLNKADCFILSSDHEGQPMTLFEALIVQKPIIATDIVGNRSVLLGRAGNLVENSIDGLAVGMLEFLEDKYLSDKKFDYEIYNQEALNMFYSKILRNS